MHLVKDTSRCMLEQRHGVVKAVVFAQYARRIQDPRLVKVRRHVLKWRLDAFRPRSGSLEVFQPVLLCEELPFLRARRH